MKTNIVLAVQFLGKFLIQHVDLVVGRVYFAHFHAFFFVRYPQYRAEHEMADFPQQFDVSRQNFVRGTLENIQREMPARRRAGKRGVEQREYRVFPPVGFADDAVSVTVAELLISKIRHAANYNAFRRFGGARMIYNCGFRCDEQEIFRYAEFV